jgi:hypothetical protein
LIIKKRVKKMMSKLYGEEYAKVVWRAEDVQALKKDWSLPRCEEWLEDNERHISDRLIELGWEVLDVLVRQNNDEEDDDE